MLTDIGRRNQDLGKRDGVIRQEIERKIVLGVGVGVDYTRDVDNEADGLQTSVSIQ